MNELQKLLADARRQLGYHETLNPDGSVRNVTRKAAASVATMSLRALELPAPPSAAGLSAVHVPQGEAAGKATTLPLAVARSSRAVTAGANLFLVEDAVQPAQGGLSGEIALPRRRGRFGVVEAANLAAVADGVDLVPGTLPYFSAEVDLETAASYGAAFTISRADQRNFNDAELSDAALAAFVLGIGRAVDEALCAAIIATTPSAFTIGAAAAKGFTVGELRALVGTAGAGATFNASGSLVAGPGVIAELCADTSATICGAWNRSACAVHQDIRVIAERLGRNGDLKLVAWVTIAPLVPVPGAFWTVAA